MRGTLGGRTLRLGRATDGERSSLTVNRGQVITPKVSLPTGRAIVGGLLIAVSALGIFAVHRAATTDARANWLILRRPVASGEAITAEDLALAPMDLYSASRDRAVSDPEQAIGKIALVPLHEGDLVLRSAIADSVADAATTGRRVGLAIDPSSALGGDLSTGDRVDVVSIPDAGKSSQIIVRGALVMSVGDGDDGGVGSAGRVRVTLAVPSEFAAQAIIDAHAAAGVTFISASTVTLDGATNLTTDPGAAGEDSAAEPPADEPTTTVAGLVQVPR